MPLSPRGREILKRLPGAVLHGGNGAGCRIVRLDARCVGCGRCVAVCPSGACTRGNTIDVATLLSAPQNTQRGTLSAALRRLARRAPVGPIQVPNRVQAYRRIEHAADRCLGCGSCARTCPAGAIDTRPPEPAV